MDLRIIVLNCNSLSSKLSEVKLFVDDEKAELVCLTETWLRRYEPKIITNVCGNADLIMLAVVWEF